MCSFCSKEGLLKEFYFRIMKQQLKHHVDPIVPQPYMCTSSHTLGHLKDFYVFIQFSLDVVDFDRGRKVDRKEKKKLDAPQKVRENEIV